MEEMANVNIEYLINTLEQKKVSVVTRKKHSYIMYQGIESEYIYVLKDGVAKISNILRDGREFNIAYVAQSDFVSLLEEKQNDGISALFNVRVESPTANFYKISRSDFWDWVREDLNLFRVVDDFYKRRLALNLEILQKVKDVYMTLGLHGVNTLGLIASTAAYTFGDDYVDSLVDYLE